MLEEIKFYTMKSECVNSSSKGALLQVEASHKTMESELLSQKARGWWFPDPASHLPFSRLLRRHRDRLTHTGHHLCEGESNRGTDGFHSKRENFLFGDFKWS